MKYYALIVHSLMEATDKKTNHCTLIGWGPFRVQWMPLGVTWESEMA
jgi:hypothetical protein